MTIAKRKSTTDDKIEAKRKIIRQSLDQITTELETELRHAASIYRIELEGDRARPRSAYCLRPTYWIPHH